VGQAIIAMGQAPMNNGSHIILVGARGAGKTTIGHALARRLDLPFYDTDRMIEEQIGESIAHFWKLHGEKAFREIETRILETIPSLPRGVIATGGGVVVSEVNRLILRANGIIVYLRVPTDQLVSRLQGSSGQRPRLTNHDSLEEEVKSVLSDRTPLYEGVAHFVIDTEGLGIGQAVYAISRCLDGIEPSKDRREGKS
jgi:shikimate kinase